MFERHYRELHNFLSGRLKDRELAADLAQECFLRVLAMQQGGEHIADPRALLYRVANNLIIDRHRRAATRNEVALIDEEGTGLEDSSYAPSAWEPEAAAMSAQGVAALLATIDALPIRCREVFILFKFDGLSYAEIGERMGISVRTVEMQLQIAMAACWDCLERLGDPQVSRRPRGRRSGKAPVR